MLKIDLLPSYFRERRAVRKYLFASGVALGGIVAVFVFWLMSLNTKLNQLKAVRDDANTKKTEVEAIRAERDKELAAAKPILDIKNFFVEANAFPPDMERLLREVARYTYGRVRILSITPTGASGGGGSEAMMGGMESMMGGGMGGSAMGMGMGGRGMGGGGGSTGPDLAAILLDCWTNDFRIMMPFINNLRRSGYFSNVSEPSFSFVPVEGGGGAGGGGGGGGGMGAAMGMQAGMGGMMSGAMMGRSTPGGMGAQGGGGAQGANLIQSRDGVRFSVTCTLVKPLKGAIQPGQQQQQAGGGMGMMGSGGMSSMMGGGMMGGNKTSTAGASDGSSAPAAGAGSESADSGSGGGMSKLGRKADIGGDE